MPRHSEEFKAKVVEKMMPPNACRVADVHRETGVSEPTLYAWRREFQGRGHAVPADPESWSGQDKLAVVIETAALNEQALSEYCRRKGLYLEQIERWKEAAMAGSAGSFISADSISRRLCRWPTCPTTRARNWLQRDKASLRRGPSSFVASRSNSSRGTHWRS